MARRSQSGTSPWVWIGCGCALFAFLAAAGIFGGGYFLFDQGRDMVETMADPQARNAKALEMLGAETMPEGYHARVALSIPFVFKMVMLSDAPVEEEPPPPDADLDTKAESFENMLVLEDDLGSHLFIVLKMRGRSDESIEEILSGDDRVKGAQADLGMEFEPEEDLGSGSFEQGEATIAWQARRGVLDLRRGSDVPGTWALVDVTCGDGSRPAGVWFESAALGVEPPAPADPAALEAFLGHFDLCV